MNNLTQQQRDAKQAYLDNQQDEMLAQYSKADNGERSAIMRQIDSFLIVTSEGKKNFCLKFRQRLERLNEQKSIKI